MQRIAIFAHYDKQNIIDPYVIKYIEELKKFCDIIFVSDCNLKSEETDKIKNLCLDFFAQKHGEYDFGSYKRGFQLLEKKYPEKMQKIDELIFVNDSCYLVGTFQEIFTNTAKEDVDFWGLTDNKINFYGEEQYHMQSFFICFRKKIFLNNKFKKFINNISKQSKKADIIQKYEIGLYELINGISRKHLCYFSSEKIDNFIKNNKLIIEEKLSGMLDKGIIKSSLKEIKNSTDGCSSNYVYSDKFYIMILNGLPLIKTTSLLTNINENLKLIYFWQEIAIDQNLENIELILNHNKRIGNKIKNYKRLNLIKFKFLIKKLLPIKFKKYYKKEKSCIVLKLVLIKFIKTDDCFEIKLAGKRLLKF